LRSWRRSAKSEEVGAANIVSTKCGQEITQWQHINLCQQEGYADGEKDEALLRKQEKQSKQTLTAISNVKKLLYNGVRK